jgi:hypothetical protein
MNEGTFDLNAFLAETKETLLNPGSYFSKMKISGGIAEPLIKAVIYGTVAGLVYMILSFLHMGGYGGMLGGKTGVTALLYTVIISVVGLFVGGAILLLISTICKGNADYEANARVAASVMAVMPVSAILSFTSGINAYLGIIVGIVMGLYMIWLLYHGLVGALKCNAETAKVVCYVIIGISFLYFIFAMLAVIRFRSAVGGI